MKVEKTTLTGVLLIKPEAHKDSRGFFCETFNLEEYRKHGITADFVQDDIAVNPKGVLKGMHGDPLTYKLVQCAYGLVYAVIANCNEKSPDFGKWEAFQLSDQNHYQLYIPPMYGNGYYVQSATAVYTYKQSTYYGDAKQFTYKWNDPRFAIEWPIDGLILSERDS